MKSSTRANMMGLMALAMMGESQMHGTGKQQVEPDTGGEKKRKEDAYKAVLKSKGVKEFNINGIIIMARTEKKAYQKFEKLKGKTATYNGLAS